MRLVLAAGVVLLLTACSSKVDEEQPATRRSPKLPPPPTTTLPTGVDIPVSIDGVKGEPVTTATLARLAPDFADADRRAWRIERLVPGATAGATIQAVSSEQVAVTMTTAGGLVPVLFVTRRGDVVATLVDPDDPFPDFHGQGGRLRRPGDTTPRVSPVLRFEIRTAPPTAPAR
jgi:hypothetical protein